MTNISHKHNKMPNGPVSFTWFLP